MSSILSLSSQRHKKKHYFMRFDSERPFCSLANGFLDTPPPNIQSSPASSHRMLWDLRLISFQQRFMSPAWCVLPPLSLLHSVPSSCPSPSTVDWHGTQWHPGHEGRPAAATHRKEEALKRAQMIGAFLNIL